MNDRVQFGLIKDDSIGGTVGLSAHDNPDPSFKEALDASFRSENLIGSALTSARHNTENFDEIDEEFDPFSNVSGYEQYIPEGRFDNVFNARALESVKARIDQEENDRKIRDAYGGSWALDMVAATLDPSILVPGGALVKAGRVGFSGIKSAAAVSAGAAVGVGVQEVGLHATQNTRTIEESAFAIGGSVVLGGLIGASGAKFFSRAEWNKFSNALEEEVADLGASAPPDEVADYVVKQFQSAGSAAADNLDLEQFGIGGSKAAKIVANATAAMRINPGLEMLHSPAKSSRKIYGEMMDSPMFTQMNMEGKSLGADVENSIKFITRGMYGDWKNSNTKLFRSARKAGLKMKEVEFNEAVSRAARRGDVDPGGNEFITQAAQNWRKKIADPMLKRAQEARALPKDIEVRTAVSYVMRLWNRARLIGEEGRFRKIASDYFRREIARLPAGVGPDFINAADMDGYIQDVVSDVFNNLTGRGHGDVPDWIVPINRGPLKERTFQIQDDLIEGFLESDLDLVTQRYTRTMGAEIELTEKFGHADMRDQFVEIEKEFDELSAQAKTAKEKDALDKRRRGDIRRLESFRDILRGTYRAGEESSEWGVITRSALTWNYMRLLGGVTLSSVPDMARVIAVHGLRSTMREALPALASGLRAAKIAREDARILGPVTERILQSRLASLAELQDPYRVGSGYERFLSQASHKFTRLTGLGWWNDQMKTVAAVMTQNRMARNIENWSNLPKNERAYMALLGIDDGNVRNLSRQLKKHSLVEDNVVGANTREWGDDAARRLWAAALNKDVDRTIVTKGGADQPLWTRSNTGKIIMQFKSFGLASHQRVLIAGLQQDQHRLAESLVFSTALGMMVSYLKFIERGDIEEAERLLENPGLFIANGLDRTGILSLPFEFSNTLEKVGIPYGITRGVQALAGDKDQEGGVSRYASRGKYGAVFGPSVGLFEDLTAFASQASQGDLKKSGANAIIRNIPGGSLPGVKSALHYGLKPWMIDAVE